MFGKIASALGIEQVKIDTKLANPSLCGGQVLNGEIVFRGVSSDKYINGLRLDLMTTAEVESGDNEYNTALCIASWQVSGAFNLQANSRHRIPFSLELPFETPLTDVPFHYNKSKVWLYTHLDIDWSLDAKDVDYLKIQPNPAMLAFMTAMQQCGFGLRSVDVEKGQLRGQGFQSTIGCYQELEFVAIQQFSMINEIEVSFVAEAHRTHVLLEIDRKMSYRDSYQCLTIPHQHIDVGQLAGQIRQLLGI